MPNIIFILADDLGYGDLSCYGQALMTTPAIDRLAIEGVKFTQFYAGSSVCAPSRNVLMTGQHTGRVMIRGNAKLNLPPETETVAKMLQRRGYKTGAMGKWGLGSETGSGAPTRQGFDAFFGYVDQTHAHNYYPEFLVRNQERVKLRNVVPSPGPQGQGVATVKLDYSADLIADEAIAFIRENSRRPFFLYYASTLPHVNNEAGEEGMEVPDLGPYADKPWPKAQKGHAAMVARLDRDVGRILQTVASLGIEQNTIIFFSSDNGPHREAGYNPAFFRSSGGFRGIKRDLYEGGIRVPFLVRWPGKIPAGHISEHVGYHGDVFATVAELSGAAPQGGLNSLSFVKAMVGSPGQDQHSHLYWESYEQGGAKAVRLGDWKGVARVRNSDKIELYDLSKDLTEAMDVATSHPEVVKRLRSVMEREHTPSEHFPRKKK